MEPGRSGRSTTVPATVDWRWTVDGRRYRVAAGQSWYWLAATPAMPLLSGLLPELPSPMDVLRKVPFSVRGPIGPTIPPGAGIPHLHQKNLPVVRKLTVLNSPGPHPVRAWPS